VTSLINPTFFPYIVDLWLNHSTLKTHSSPPNMSSSHVDPIPGCTLALSPNRTWLWYHYWGVHNIVGIYLSTCTFFSKKKKRKTYKLQCTFFSKKKIRKTYKLQCFPCYALLLRMWRTLVHFLFDNDVFW
jgi:hypothetical protein